MLILAIGVGVWLTSSDGGGGAAAPTEQEDPAAERRDAAADRREDRREEAEDRREDRLDELEDRSGSDNETWRALHTALALSAIALAFGHILAVSRFTATGTIRWVTLRVLRARSRSPDLHGPARRRLHNSARRAARRRSPADRRPPRGPRPRRRGDTVLIAGGSGITPSMSVLRTAALEDDPRRLTLLYFLRDATRPACAEELAELGRRDPRRTLRPRLADEGASTPAGCIAVRGAAATSRR